MPKCAICRNHYKKLNMKHKLCGEVTCGIQWAEQEREKKERKEARLEARRAAEERKIHKAKVEKLKPLSWFEKKCEAAVNRYCRLRDLALGFGCISCDKPNSWNGQWHASHFKSVGANSFLRYNVWNINLGCSQCNKWLSGNIGEYTKRLPAKIGQERFEYLETAPRERRFTREYLERLTKIANRRAKRYEPR
jgi:hypothetical protein